MSALIFDFSLGSMDYESILLIPDQSESQEEKPPLVVYPHGKLKYIKKVFASPTVYGYNLEC